MSEYICNDCPRRCGVVRSHYTPHAPMAGYCHTSLQPVVARAALHFWEEPCISGTRGSGTVFFTSCNLRCCFCQNASISTGGTGIPITVKRLREIYGELIAQGAHNINLVTPTPYTWAVRQSLEQPLPVPVVYNCGGYEAPETIDALRGKVQIYLPDLKYMDSNLAKRYSGAADYPQAAAEAILRMYDQVGPYELDDDGILQKGVVIRHLILPGCVENTKAVIDWVRSHFADGQVLFSLMRQYVPCGKAADYPEIDRFLTDEEYDEAEQYLFDSGIEDGFVQEKDSASETFIPSFCGEGVLKSKKYNIQTPNKQHILILHLLELNN